MSEQSSSAGTIAKLGVGLLAVVGVIGKFALRSADDAARVASHGADDLLRTSDDVLRSGNALRHLDDAGTGAPWQRAGGALDNAAGVPRGFASSADNLEASGLSSRAHFFSNLPGSQALNPLDELAAQESRYADSLGTLGNAKEATPTAVGRVTATYASPSGLRVGDKNSIAAAALRDRVAASRAQLAEQMAKLRRLQAANQPLDAKLAAEVAAQQHDRSLDVLTRAHTLADSAPPTELARAANEIRPAAETVAAAETTGERAIAATTDSRAAASDLAASPATATTAPRAANEPLESYLQTQARKLAIRHGVEFFKHLLQVTDQELSRENESQLPGVVVPASLPPVLASLASAPERPLTSDEKKQLEAEIVQLLRSADADLNQLSKISAATVFDEQYFGIISRATLVRVRIHRAAEALKRIGE